MRFVGLISGGKDSIFNIVKCVEFGHTLVAVANLAPPVGPSEELDSYMFQTVGCSAVQAIADCLGVPLFQQTLTGTSVLQDLEYSVTDSDEVEDLHALLSVVKSAIPSIEAVSVGAVLSDYQRTRVENVCMRLGLTSLSYLWRRNQAELLDEMICAGMESIIIKVACIGLSPKKHLGRTIAELQPVFLKLNKEYDSHVCGEGGEYETFTLDCPLFKRRIVLDKTEQVMHSDDLYAPVGYLKLAAWHLEDKPGAPKDQELNLEEPVPQTAAASVLRPAKPELVGVALWELGGAGPWW